MRAKLVGSREVGPNTRHFEFEALDWDTAFVPGQFVSVTQTHLICECITCYTIFSILCWKIFFAPSEHYHHINDYG